MNAEQKYPFHSKAALISLGLLSFISMLYIAQTILIPIIYATIIAIALNPFVNFLTRKKFNRTLAITITLTLVVTIGIAGIVLISGQLIQFSDSFPRLIDKYYQLLDQSVGWLSINFNISPNKINHWIGEQKAEFLIGTRNAIGQTIINTGSALVVLVLIPVYIFMILFYKPQLIEFIHKLFSANKHLEVNAVLVATKRIIQSYLVGLLLEALIVAALNSIGLLVLGIDYAILLGIIGAILNVIPYLGGIIGVALPMIVALVTKSPTYALLVLALYTLIQFIDNNYIITKIVSSKVQINALISVIVVLAGGALWGIPGMFLSIPLTAILKVIFDHVDGLKPWGYLLGNIVPVVRKTIKL